MNLEAVVKMNGIYAIFFPTRTRPSNQSVELLKDGAVRWTGDRFTKPPEKDLVAMPGFSMLAWADANKVEKYAVRDGVVNYSDGYTSAPFELGIMYCGQFQPQPVDSGFD